mgnify:FL=1
MSQTKQIHNETYYNNSNQYDYYKQLIEESGAIDHVLPLLSSEEEELPIIRKILLVSLLHRKCTPSTIITAIQKYFKNLQEAANYLELCITTYDIIDWDQQYIYTKITISQEAQTHIDRYGFPLPLIIKPKQLTCNTDTGYYSDKPGTVLQKRATTEYDVNLDFLNQVNSIPLEFNEDLLAKIPLAKPKEVKQLAAHTKFVKHLSHSRALLTKTIYLTHGYDRRGRVYARGHHYSYQGCDWNKATLSFRASFRPDK